VKTTRIGAYGLAIEGFDAQGLFSCPQSWPKAHLRQKCVEAPEVEFYLTADSATVPLLGGGIWELRRNGLEGVLTFPRQLEPDELAHPALAGAGCVLAYWLGHEVFHAGSFVVNGRGWGVLGDKNAGKTTLLADLSLLGHGVLADDMLVVDTQRLSVLAGPRCLDLRPDAADLLEARTVVTRQGQRRRIMLSEVAPETPFAGWIELVPDDRIEIVSVPPSKRLARLSANRTLQALPTDPGALLRLAALPFFEVRRPKSWDLMSDVVSQILTLTD
jgi:hypothetical protein